MCGISGAIWTSGPPVEPEVLARMTDVLAHRGPDDRGEYRSDLRHGQAHGPTPGIALGHRRLSIIDVAGGKQPLSNEDGTIWVVLNGEIYNFGELRRRLEGTDHRFQTSSDTETIVHLYEDEGTSCFRRLRGMFALAIWDARRGELVLARDRLGKKPLYYRDEPGRLSFGSEIKALLELPGAPRNIDPASLDEYLTYGYVPHPGTMFVGIKKLPPASCAVWRDGQLRIERYWQPDLSLDERIALPEAIERLRETLTESVRLRLQSEVPLGAFLSGGVDSSIVVALAQQQSGRPVQTFSIGFAAKEYDESAAAREFARRLGTEHREFRVEPAALELLPQLVRHYDDPLADSSAIPTWYVSREARRHVTVALTGDGGDELFAGYARHRAVRLASVYDRRCPRWARRMVDRVPWNSLAAGGDLKTRWARTGRFLSALSLPPGRRYLRWIGLFTEEQRVGLYSESFLARLPESDPFEFLKQALARGSKRDAATAAGIADLFSYLPCDLLAKVDVASMAHGLECRQPLLDHLVVEQALRLPIDWKIRGGRGKYILRRAFGSLVPRGVFRRKKSGFGVPLNQWLRGELYPAARQILLDGDLDSAGIFQRDAVERMLVEHREARADHSARLWALLFFESWRRCWGATLA